MSINPTITGDDMPFEEIEKLFACHYTIHNKNDLDFESIYTNGSYTTICACCGFKVKSNKNFFTANNWSGLNGLILEKDDPIPVKRMGDINKMTRLKGEKLDLVVAWKE